MSNFDLFETREIKKASHINNILNDVKLKHLKLGCPSQIMDAVKPKIQTLIDGGLTDYTILDTVEMYVTALLSGKGITEVDIFCGELNDDHELKVAYKNATNQVTITGENILNAVKEIKASANSDFNSIR